MLTELEEYLPCPAYKMEMELDIIDHIMGTTIYLEEALDRAKRHGLYLSPPWS